ncbi:MAG TPA: heme o synthase [Alphaproteobacteria bacterium]|nr:protoheme IX farnesyltransferase [Rhodospirillaceae bacterium]HRJ11609.1 heme o synthase [Alphaproteobacteria bacterium]
MTDAIPVQSAASISTARDYFQLLKPRVMLLVVFTGLCGLLLAPVPMHPFLAAIAVLCIALSAGGAGAINMWLERDKDALMNRTRMRPLPSGRVTADDALALGVFCVAASTGLMAIAVNGLSAVLLLLAALFYIFIYTIWLKPRTVQNIVIGGAAGAFPPMIGWAAATNDITLAPVILFLIIFMWTPPHFWALSLYAREDYARAGFPMLPVVAGEEETKIQILVYTLLLFPITLLPTFLGTAGMIYFWSAVALGGLFILSALRVMRDTANENSYKTARQMFGYSIFYLFMIFLIMVIDKS